MISRISVGGILFFSLAGAEVASISESLNDTLRIELMDTETLECFKPLLTAGNGRSFEIPPFLTEAEITAFLMCRDENIRLEQERIPHSELQKYLVRFGLDW